MIAQMKNAIRRIGYGNDCTFSLKVMMISPRFILFFTKFVAAAMLQGVLLQRTAVLNKNEQDTKVHPVRFMCVVAELSEP